jgi:hypothetical protein
MRSLPAAIAVASLAVADHAAPGRPGYVLDAQRPRDGYPRAPIETAKGVCAGFVLGPPPQGARASKRVLHLPRTLLPLPNGDFLVADLGAWAPGQGSVWRLTPHSGQQSTLKPLLAGLDMPHTIAIGPNGGVYVGEMSRIIRFDPDAPDPAASVKVVVSGLPSNRLHDDRHPLSSFLFDADNALLVNVGAPSDPCAPLPDTLASTCPEAEGAPSRRGDLAVRLSGRRPLGPPRPPCSPAACATRSPWRAVRPARCSGARTASMSTIRTSPMTPSTD